MNEMPPKFLNSPIVARARKIKQLMDQEAMQARTRLEHNKSEEGCTAIYHGQTCLLDEELQRLWEQHHEWGPLDVWKNGDLWEKFENWDSWDKAE